jgi:GNAT superfamily N-acetyltransferase
MGYLCDDNPARVDADALWAFLSNDAYWGRYRSRGDVDRQVSGAWRVVGCYEEASGAMVGFCRAVSDGVALAYLADVYVLPEHRGRGLGKRLVEHMVEGGPGADFRWLLHTADAHGLYEQLGFGAPDATLLERPHGTKRASGQPWAPEGWMPSGC